MDEIFEAAGTLRGAYAAVDWAATPLGPVAAWSPTLKATVRMMLRTRFAVTLMWGPQYVLVYNEAYVPMIDEKHPAALGSPAREVFPEIWDTIGPMLDSAGRSGEATWVDNLRLLMNRHGYLEETYFTFSYSPVAGPDGTIEGVVDIAAETTAQVVGNRRLVLLARLNDRLADVDDRVQLIERALPLLRSAADDLPEVTVLHGEPAVPAAVGGHRAEIPVAADIRLEVRLSPHLAPDEDYLGFLRLLGSTLGQAMDRMEVRRAERRLAAMERELSMSLQAALLTRVADPAGVQVAVRYRSAMTQAHIGGDWYDAFLLPTGDLALAVGDVTGHDRRAAAAMAQVRNLLRGIAYTVQSPPSRILAALGDAMAGLQVDALATVVLAQLTPGADGHRILTWANAGHPPPVLITPDGTARLLEHPGEPLLGVPAGKRTDHAVSLAPGSVVVFWTDGLIERRDVHLDDGLCRLVAELTGRAHRDAEEVCDRLLARFAGHAEDDIALTVVRV